MSDYKYLRIVNLKKSANLVPFEQKLVLSVLLNLQRKNKKPTSSALLKTGLRLTTIKRVLNELRTAGLIDEDNKLIEVPDFYVMKAAESFIDSICTVKCFLSSNRKLVSMQDMFLLSYIARSKKRIISNLYIRKLLGIKQKSTVTRMIKKLELSREIKGAARQPLIRVRRTSAGYSVMILNEMGKYMIMQDTKERKVKYIEPKVYRLYPAALDKEINTLKEQLFISEFEYQEMKQKAEATNKKNYMEGKSKFLHGGYLLKDMLLAKLNAEEKQHVQEVQTLRRTPTAADLGFGPKFD